MQFRHLHFLILARDCAKKEISTTMFCSHYDLHPMLCGTRKQLKSSNGSILLSYYRNIIWSTLSVEQDVKRYGTWETSKRRTMEKKTIAYVSEVASRGKRT